MHVYCSTCKYDSGDFDDPKEIAKKVNDDSGHMELSRDPETGKSNGWVIICPNCGCNDQISKNIHMD